MGAVALDCTFWQRAGGPFRIRRDPVGVSVRMGVFQALLHAIRQCLISMTAACIQTWPKDGDVLEHIPGQTFLEGCVLVLDGEGDFPIKGPLLGAKVQHAFLAAGHA